MRSKTINARPRGPLRLAFALAAVGILGFVHAVPARAGLVYTGTTNSAISFGASGYVPGNGSPHWITNNVTGLNDILSSPGGTFGVANPVTGNNVASVGPAAYGPGTTQFLNWTGGTAPLSGAPFGSGAARIYGPVATFALTDATLGGGGAASYGIETWTSNFVQTTAYHGTFGTFLSIGGNVGIVGSSAIAALQSEVTVNGVAYVFAPEILAIGNLGGGNYTYAYNSASGANIRVNSLTGAFSGLAIDSYAANFAAGSHISVTSTLTFYADPASIDSFTPDLSLIPGASLPGEVLFGSSVPEPSTAVMGGTALLVLSAFGWLQARRRKLR
jgi:hypothetical protein